MSTYVPNFTKTPVEIMLGLINHDNQKGYAPDDVALRNLLPLVGDATGKNTTIEVDLLKAPSEVDGDWVQFWFDRMELQGIFSDIVAKKFNNVREVEIVNDDGQLNVNEFIGEVLRKYGVAINVADFDITMPTAQKIVVAAKPSNYAYIGSVEFTVDASLETRVDIPALSGFSAGHVDLDPSDD